MVQISSASYHQLHLVASRTWTTRIQLSQGRVYALRYCILLIEIFEGGSKVQSNAGVPEACKILWPFPKDIADQDRPQ